MKYQRFRVLRQVTPELANEVAQLPDVQYFESTATLLVPSELLNSTSMRAESCKQYGAYWSLRRVVAWHEARGLSIPELRVYMASNPVPWQRRVRASNRQCYTRRSDQLPLPRLARALKSGTRRVFSWFVSVLDLTTRLGKNTHSVSGKNTTKNYR